MSIILNIFRLFLTLADSVALLAFLIGIAGIDNLSQLALSLVIIPMLWLILRMICCKIADEVRYELSDYDRLK